MERALRARMAAATASGRSRGSALNLVATARPIAAPAAAYAAGRPPSTISTMSVSASRTRNVSGTSLVAKWKFWTCNTVPASSAPASRPVRAP